MDSERFLGRYVSMLYRYRRSFMCRRLAHLGRAAGAYVFLLTLARQDGQNQEQISAHLGCDKATTCKGLQKLEQQGFVRREVDLDDRRAYRVYLTPQGHAAVPDIRAAVREWDALVSVELSAAEEDRLTQMLRELAAKACAAAAPPKEK